jgi:hypothetical protein
VTTKTIQVRMTLGVKLMDTIRHFHMTNMTMMKTRKMKVMAFLLCLIVRLLANARIWWRRFRMILPKWPSCLFLWRTWWRGIKVVTLLK